MATVTLELAEYQKLADDKKESDARIAQLEKDVINAKLGDPESELRAMAKIVRAALQVTRFAMANLSPEAIKGWPFADLEFLGKNVFYLPDCTVDDETLGTEMIAFAKECERRYMTPTKIEKISSPAE